MQHSLRERRLLIVEDSPTMRRVMRRYLQSTGYVIFEAGDGEEALTVAARERPDVILLDVQIPLVDGYGVLASLQADPELSQVPVVLVTSRSEPEDVADGLRRGAHDYLRKPFKEPELLARVHAAMRAKTARDELRARNAQLERLVTTDRLTGLLNRDALSDRLRAMVSRSERHEIALSLVLLEVAAAGRADARLSHGAAEALLEEVAARVGGGLREEDVAGRWGPDRLAVVAPDTDADGAAALLARLRGAVGVAPVAVPDDEVVVDLAAGASTWAHGDDVDALVARAEEALAADMADRHDGDREAGRGEIPRSGE